MIVDGSGDTPDRDVERVARALFARGATREGIAMLRGAVVRDRDAYGCRELLDRILAGVPPPAPDAGVELDLALVDRWIRSGMLVEALALLGGTRMGSLETGREWANLLGELLAPVPVDADAKLVAMHGQLLSGGASVALVLLEERAAEQPPPPAWASRRLEVLRWMLLDNASAAEEQPRLPMEVPSLLAGEIRLPIHQRNLVAAAQAAYAFAQAHPRDADAQRTADALAGLLAEVELQTEQAEVQMRTIPIFGRPAAALQIRMCNLANAASVYARVLEQHPDDPDIRRLADHVDAVLRALSGESVADGAEDPWDDETTHLDGVRGQTADTVPPVFTEESTVRETGRFDGGVPPTVEHALGPEKSGPMSVLDMGPTEQMPDAGNHVAQLVAADRFEDAENMLRAMARLFPDDPSLLRQAEDLRARRLGTGEVSLTGDDDDVVVHRIRPVK